MAGKYRKPFLTELTKIWADRFPDWRPNPTAPVHSAQNDAAFTCDKNFSKTGRVFHAAIVFSSKWPGAFTCDIIIASDQNPISGPTYASWPDDVSDLPFGHYRIGSFVAGRDIWWRLVDDAAESKMFWQSSSLPPDVVSLLSIPRHENHWYASHYSLPFASIVREAVDNFTDTFAFHVIPKLALG